MAQKEKQTNNGKENGETNVFQMLNLSLQS